MATLGKMKAEVSIDASKLNEIVKVQCRNTSCKHHGGNCGYNETGCFCDRKHIHIEPDGRCGSFERIEVVDGKA